MLGAIEFLLLCSALMASTLLSTSGLAWVYGGLAFEFHPAVAACLWNLVGALCWSAARRKVDAAGLAFGALLAFVLLASWRAGFRFGAWALLLGSMAAAPTLGSERAWKLRERRATAWQILAPLGIGFGGALLMQRFCTRSLEMRWVASSMAAMGVLACRLLLSSPEAGSHKPFHRQHGLRPPFCDKQLAPADVQLPSGKDVGHAEALAAHEQ